MIKKSQMGSLKRQFITRMLLVMIVIVLVLGSVQVYFMINQFKKNIESQANLIGGSIEQGVSETDLASRAIEKQLDLKLKVISQRISDRLSGRSVHDITNEELIAIGDEFNVAGITLLAAMGDDVVGTKSTDKNEIGFSFKKMFGPKNEGYLGMKDLLNNVTPSPENNSYTDHNTIILYTSQSGSHQGTPEFFKYAYYHAEGQDFIIAPYIKANEVYHFTQEVGPNTLIENVLKKNEYAKEVAVLDPRVYADPSLAEKMYPPLEKVVYGDYKLSDKKDEKTLISIAKNPRRVVYTVEKDGVDIYKMFIPISEDKVVYVALDSTLMSKPLQNLTIILIVLSILSLVAMFILSTRFFSSIYKNIQVIISQIKKLENGDFTSKSEVKTKGELADLSASTNHMTETLNGVLKDTTKQAEKVQYLSKELKSEADESVDKMYALSLDLTSKAREDNFEISDFLDTLEEKLKEFPKTENIESILTRVEAVREISNNRSESTTDITITLSDLLKSLQVQSEELLDISSTLFKNMYKFKL